MEIILAILTVIICIFLWFIFRKPIKRINDSSDRIGEIVKNKIDMWADSAVVAAEENRKRCEERLKEAGIAESLDEIIEKYRTLKKMSKNISNYVYSPELRGE